MKTIKNTKGLILKLLKAIVAILILMLFMLQYVAVPSHATAEQGSFTMAEFPYNISFKEISAGMMHAGAIDTSGNLWMWGYNGSGQLGNGTTRDSNVPIKIKDGTKFKKTSLCKVMSYYDFHTGAIDEDGNLWMWGDNTSGQLGDGTTTTSKVPIKIKDGTKFKEVSLGKSYTGAIDEDGNLWMWGKNNKGQLGDGTTTTSKVPIKIKDGTKFLQISLYNETTGAIDEDGNLWMWGDNTSGQLGNGTTTNSSTPIKIKEETKFSQISLGNATTGAIDTSENLWMWGGNSSGQLGNGTTTTSKVPIKIKDGTKFKEISLGKDHSGAIDTSGNLWMWGSNSSGQLGNGTTTTSKVPIKIKDGTKFETISLAYNYTTAIAESKNSYIWGTPYALGNGTRPYASEPIKVKEGTSFKEVDAAQERAGMIDTSGNLWMQGFGYIGNGNNYNSGSEPDEPIKIKDGTKFKKVSLGGNHSGAIDTDGNLWMWGYNSKGQLGNGTTTASSVPIKIKEGTKFTDLSLGNAYTGAIDTSGNLWMWGSNSYGQLGNGTTTDSTVPIKIKDGTKFSQISLGNNSAGAVDTSGNLWMWGRNYNGILGNGTTTDSTVPIKIKDGTKFKDISVSMWAGAIDTSGNLWMWGPNNNGNLGNGTKTASYTPIKIKDGTKFKDINLGAFSSAAIDESGNLWTCGLNAHGQLGNGTTTDSSTLIKVKEGTTFKYVSRTLSYSYNMEYRAAIDTSGKLWMWGYNDTGTNSLHISSRAVVEPLQFTNYVDSEKPTVTITRSDYNTFSWTASDNAGVTGYQITTSSGAPLATGSGWTTTGTLTSGTYDISSAGTYYVWAKDAAGNVSDSASITAYTLTKTQGANTTLTIKEGSSSGVEISSTTAVLNGTTIYVSASANTGYTLVLHVSGTNFNSGTTKVISANTIVESSATSNNYTITLNNQSATTAGTASLTEKYGDGIYNSSNKMTTSSNAITKPTKTGYTFGGYYTNTGGSGTQMIDANGYITSSFTSTYYTAAGTLYAKWTDATKPTVTITRSDYNTFSWTASDNVGVTGYQITTSSGAPLATGSGWTTTGTLTSGTYDISSAGTYYVWTKDAAGNVSNSTSITAYTLTKTQGANTTLTIKEGSSSGTEISSTTAVLNGTTIYVSATADAGYTLGLIVGGTAFTSGNTTQISANTTVESSVTANTYTITLNTQNATTAGRTILTEKYGDGIYLESSLTNKMTTSSNPIMLPTKTGYAFGGYYTETNGAGTQMINENGYITSSFTSTYYTESGTLYAKWIDNAGPTITASDITYGQDLSIKLEDSGSGVVAWQVNDSSSTPESGWTTITKTTSTTVSKSGLSVGEYYIWAKDDIGNVSSKKIQVAKANATNPTLTPYNGTYDGIAHSITASGGNNGTVYYSTDNSTWSTDNPSRTNAGTTTIYVKVVGDSNYNDTTPISSTITINRRPITVTSSNAEKVYDGTALTKNEVQVTSGELVSGQTFEGTSNGTITNVGTTSNTISSAKVMDGETDVTTNYQITQVQGTLEVKPRELTVTANSKVKEQGTTDPEFDYTYSNNVEGETPGFTGTLTREEGENVTGDSVNPYEITQGTLALDDNGTFNKNNYTINFISNTLEIIMAKALSSGGIIIKSNNNENEQYQWIVVKDKMNSVPSGIVTTDKDEFLESVNLYKGYYLSTEENNYTAIYIPIEQKWSGYYDETSEYIDENGETALIPEGFRVSRTAGQNNIQDGLVIQDEDGNSYVWVKVPKSIYQNKLYTVGNNGAEVMIDTDYTGIYNILEAYVSDYRNENYTDKWYAISNGTYITEDTENLTDAQKNLTNGCGLKYDEYINLRNQMLKSIYNNGGFWISQYEVGASSYVSSNDYGARTAVIKEDQYPYNYVTCPKAQELATNMNSGDKTSSLLFGIQWDLALKFINTNGEKTNSQIESDSSSWGNYSNSSFKVKKGKFLNYSSEERLWTSVSELTNSIYQKNNGSKVLFTTGATKRNRVLNIYDLAGNAWEWTLEKADDQNYPCTVRGGNFNDDGSTYGPSVYRGNNLCNSEYINNNVGFRVAIY